MVLIFHWSLSFAFVEFEERRDAEDAFDKFDGFSVEGRRLKLDWDVGINKKEDRRSTRQGGERDP
jgi:transformer-2 protein